jgi:hypothetical protein
LLSTLPLSLEGPQGRLRRRWPVITTIALVRNRIAIAAIHAARLAAARRLSVRAQRFLHAAGLFVERCPL